VGLKGEGKIRRREDRKKGRYEEGASEQLTD
jgi:hypothetical protein